LKLLCDEDIGTRVPKALTLVRYRTMSIAQKGWTSWKDPKWLALAGNKKWLVFSCNKRMLKVAEERNAIIQNNVGIVFLTNGEEHLPRVLKLLLMKWEWLNYIDENEPRPFAYFLYPTGQYKKQILQSTNHNLIKH
jgi:hypothetical protein